MVYLNNALTSYPKPKSVLRAVHTYLQDIPFSPNHSDYAKDKDLNIIEKCRKKLAYLLNVEYSEDIIFTSSATEALNLVIKGLPVEKSHLITTSIEHNAVLRPLKAMESEKHIQITIVEADQHGQINPLDIEEAVKPCTKAVIVNHCSCTLGSITDIKKISQICKTHNLFYIIDASQTIGTIPINIKEIKPDFLIFSGHKGLFGITGIGGLYMKKGLDIKPLIHGATCDLWQNLYQPHKRPVYYESGTPNLPAIAGLEAGISFIMRYGIENIRKRKEKAYIKVMERLTKEPKICIFGKEGLKDKLPIISFNINDLPASSVGFLLEREYNIITRGGVSCEPLVYNSIDTKMQGSVGISFSVFNTEEETDIFIEAINQIIKQTDKVKHQRVL
jgi:cysteine desulfurase / selenocysteine lyase